MQRPVGNKFQRPAPAFCNGFEHQLRESMAAMSRFQACVGSWIVASLLLTAPPAQAMSFPQFDAMSARDRQAYLNFLVDAAQKTFIREGHTDTAGKVYQLFNEIHPGDNLSLGTAEFEENLANARVSDAERYAQDHHVQRIQVEAALTVTLKKNGFALTPDFFRALMQIANTFKPTDPLQSK